MLEVITVCHDIAQADILRNSLIKNKWNYSMIQAEWKGFGTKLIATYEYLKENPQVTEFIFCDAFDVICFGGEDEFRKKLKANYPDADMVLSAEKGCWPNGSLADQYPFSNSNFKYLNSGCYYSTREKFIEIIESNPIEYHDDDQLYFTKYFLGQQWLNMNNVLLDTEQVLFNSHSFIDEGEYGYDNGRVQILGNEPLFIHSNGRTIDSKLDEIL